LRLSTKSHSPNANALAISTHFVVPVSLDYLSVIGIGILLGRIKELSSDLDQEIENAGVIISRVGRPAQHRETTEATIRAQLPSLVFAQTIKDRTRVSAAAENRTSIFDSGDAAAVAEFTAVFIELSQRIGLVT